MAAGGTSLLTSVGLCGPSVADKSEEKMNGTKLAGLLIDEGTKVLRKFLESTHPGSTLQDALDNNRPKLEGLRWKQFLFDEQWEKLFPSLGKPDPQKFDITLLHLLLHEICHLSAPPTGWHKMPADADASPEASIVRIKCYGNELCHSVSTGVPNDEFEDKWDKISSSLEVLKVAVYRKKLQSLKSAPIDHKAHLVEEELDARRREKELEKSGKVSELSSCLPDDLPGEHDIIGRGDQIQDIKEKVESGTVPVILITGGPGFGKTTVAKRVACELDRLKDRTVFFCSLLSKKTFHDVTMEMFNSCSKVVNTQVPENPGQWLKDWSKQIHDQVTFVLDNADGVLESDHREPFLETLRDVRKLSRRNVTFVITARTTFENPDLPLKEVRLPPLSTEQAKNLLVSQVRSYKQDVQHELCKAEQLVKLCGCVPLALCIVGSLLSDFAEETLIKNLEREPLAVLEDDHGSVEKAIKTSFDLLTEAEREAFVLMSTFQVSFSSVAAEAVMKAFSIPGIWLIKIIRSLKRKSLIEQPSSRRYQMHPLIHSYARKTGLENDPDLLVRGEKLACVHFISCLANNANMYWRKDSCKESLDLFKEDRDNFEYFLHIYTQRRKDQDEKIAECSKTFLESFPQKCMYLQKCLPPKIYAHILEQLLDTFDSVLEPVNFVELSCTLGHECRKKDQMKYNELMRKVKRIYSLNSDEFDRNPLAKVYFHNSYARFLSDKKDPSEKQRIERENQIALDVCYASLGDRHPETAATLLLTGIIAQRLRNRDVAKERLTKALELFQDVLGKHFMTAETLKAIADLLLAPDKSVTDLKPCLKYYEAALEIFDHLGVGGSKESILPLKNFASCHTTSGNFDEAIKLFRKAEQVAERELEKNHTWKVSIKTSLGLLHEKMGKVELAKKAMLEGLLMHKGLGLAMDKIGNKFMIRKFMNRYPKIFPEAEFPRSELAIKANIQAKSPRLDLHKKGTKKR